MRSKLITLGLFAATGAAVALLPAAQITLATPPDIGAGTALQGRPRVEVVFVLDTTGSMGPFIATAKEKIWSIASTMASANETPEIRMGLVAYRDRGDRYVTRIVDLASDLDSVYASLMDFQATGGGDTPESVNAALHDAVHRISWSRDPNTYRAIFLVGDAPPHMDYSDDPPYPHTVATARQQGIVVNTIQCGQRGATTAAWRHIAALGEGRYVEVASSGNAVALATPFDERMAELSARLDETRLYYGDAAVREEQARKVEATRKLHAGASLASRARRAAFNASPSGARNRIGESELIDAVTSGRVELSEVPASALPEPLRAMPPTERRAVIAQRAAERAALTREIEALGAKRADYLERRLRELGGAEGSLDHEFYRAVREQAAGAGLSYDATAPRY